MKIHYLQHVPFEDLGMMAQELMKKGHELTVTKFYEPFSTPLVNNFDGLIVMGGPMGVNDESIFPWLKTEKQLIEQAIDHNKPVLGICLGAQLIAQVLGARVYKNKHREIGWFDIQILPDISQTMLADAFPKQARVFHWHGDTFDIPDGATHIAKSEACANQGFVFENQVVGFQFHLESTLQTVQNLILNCRDEIDGSAFVQPRETLVCNTDYFAKANHLMCRVLDTIFTDTNHHI